MFRGFGLALALLAGIAIAAAGSMSPWAKGTGTPFEAFAADRAFRDVEVMARTPHPIGSPANAANRDYLLMRMTELGLHPRVQTGPVFEQRKFDGVMWTGGGRPENVIGVLPGRDPSKPAIAVMAHYDSVPGSPGAADDVTGVAAALEIARALKTASAHNGGPGAPARDVVFLITDGEEAGLLGAREFFASNDPLVGHIGAVINMEARGGGGRANMFQTGAGNGEWVKLFARTADHPVASSLTVFLYEHMPNDTDFTVSKAKGLPGLNFAFIGRQFDYHSPSSTPANLDKGSLQHIGDQALAATRAVAFAETLPDKAPDAVYSQTFGNWMIVYPVWGGWIVLAACALLMGVAAWRARRAGMLDGPDVARGVGVALYLIVASAAMLNLARLGTGAGFGWLPYRRLLAAFGTWEATAVLVLVAVTLATGAAAAKGRARIVMAVLVAAAGAGASSLNGWDMVDAGLGGAGAVIALLTFGRPIARTGAWAGILATGFILALAAQGLAPIAGYLVAWPLLLGALAAAVSALGGDGKFNSKALRWIVAVAAIGWLGVYFHGVIEGLDLAAALALFAWLTALAAWPLLQSKDPDEAGVTPVILLFAVGVVAVVFLRMHEPWSARHPRVTQVMMVADTTDNSFWRVGLTPDLDPWTRSALGTPLSRRDVPPLSSKPADAVRAGAFAAPAPQVAVTRTPEGRVEVRATSPVGTRILLNLTSTAAASGLTIDGRAAQGLETAGAGLNLRWQSAPDGLVVSFLPRGPGRLTVDWAGVTGGWPGSPLPARPADAMAWDLSDRMAVRGATQFSW